MAPALLEDNYNVADAVVVGTLLISLLRHADRVHAASLAQLVNVIAPIMTEPGGRAWRQTIFHPFAQASRYAAGDVLQVAVEAPTLRDGEVRRGRAVDAVATRDAETGDVAVFAVNRSLTETVTLEVDLRSLPGLRVVEATTLANPDHTWSATADDDTSVAPRVNTTATVRDGRVSVQVPPVSWNVVRLGV